MGDDAALVIRMSEAEYEDVIAETHDAGYDAGSAATLARVVTWLRGDQRLYESFGWVAEQLEHGVLDRAGEVESHDG